MAAILEIKFEENLKFWAFASKREAT